MAARGQQYQQLSAGTYLAMVLQAEVSVCHGACASVRVCAVDARYSRQYAYIHKLRDLEIAAPPTDCVLLSLRSCSSPLRQLLRQLECGLCARPLV